MKVVDSIEMKSIEGRAISEASLTELILMENAGKAVSDFITGQCIRNWKCLCQSYPPPAKEGTGEDLVGFEDKPITILVGPGNNGGDGLVVARLLSQKGCRVEVVLLAEAETLAGLAKTNLEKLPDSVDVKIFSKSIEIKSGGIIVDAIFGTGLKRGVEGVFKDVIELANNTEGIKISIDLPSGISSDSGKVMGVGFKADYTLTLGLPKTGLFLSDALDFCGKIEVLDIGIPKKVVDGIKSHCEFVDGAFLKGLTMKRVPSAHKGAFGHLLVIAADRDRLGAGYLASMAGLRSGVGLVTLALPEGAYKKFDARFPEVMPLSIPDDGKGFFTTTSFNAISKDLKKYDAVVIGPALGTNDETISFVESVIKGVDLPMVCDADGINAISKLGLGFLKGVSEKLVLTPHLGEMSRLISMDLRSIKDDRISIASNFAKENKCTLVLKGNYSIVASDDGQIFINSTGNAGMATAGSGDVLSGIVGAHLAKGLAPKNAAIIAAYLHGLAGDIAADEVGEEGLVASDLLLKLAQAEMRLS